MSFEHYSPVCSLLLHLLLLRFDLLHLLGQLSLKILDLVAAAVRFLVFVVLVLQLLFQPENWRVRGV